MLSLLSIQPLANKVCDYLAHDRKQKIKYCRHQTDLLPVASIGGDNSCIISYFHCIYNIIHFKYRQGSNFQHRFVKMLMALTDEQWLLFKEKVNELASNPDNLRKDDDTDTPE